jgi:hypothetical protein
MKYEANFDNFSQKIITFLIMIELALHQTQIFKTN